MRPPALLRATGTQGRSNENLTGMTSQRVDGEAVWGPCALRALAKLGFCAVNKERRWVARFFSLPYDLVEFARGALPSTPIMLLGDRKPIERAVEHTNPSLS